VSTIIPEPPPQPTYRAQLTIPAGLDETRLAVVDDTAVIAETTWRDSSYDQPGPAAWDWRLHALGYERLTRWEPNALGSQATVQPIIRKEHDQES
jgi:hypothetical protein